MAVLKESASNVMAAVPTAGVNSLFHDLKSQIEHETSIQHRKWGLWLLEQFVRRSKATFTEYVPLVLKFVLARVAESNDALLQSVADALGGVVASVELDVLITHIDFIRSCISSTASDVRHSAAGHTLVMSSTGDIQLPLFSVPKSLEPLLAVFIHGVMNGNPQVRENAADGIGEIALMTDSTSLKPYLIKSTGPLIRVVGDRIPSNVKTSILQVSCFPFPPFVCAPYLLFTSHSLTLHSDHHHHLRRHHRLWAFSSTRAPWASRPLPLSSKPPLSRH